MEPPPRDPPAVAGGPLRVVLLAVGAVLTVLAVVGAFVPLLPTTPFLLLAAACFVRSSAGLHRRLLANPTFGPYLRQWERDRSLPPGARGRAVALVVVTFAISLLVLDETWHRVLLLALGAGLVTFLLRLPVASEREEPEPAAERESDPRP